MKPGNLDEQYAIADGAGIIGGGLASLDVAKVLIVRDCHCSPQKEGS